MKPIKLKIKGLNSFIEEQVIDFEKLTSKGLFGIFGPTGSGKSTILDAITLALYGKLPRNSSNYININCEYLNISYEFKISENKPKRYVVERRIKRDKHSGNPVSDKAKIIHILDDEFEVLEDKKTQVDKKCEEIIGLSIDDFTRTVVLPQGKFSEFLTLKGKDRRNMLERLFSLEKYGDILSNKLQKTIYKEQTSRAILNSNLKGYEDVSEDILKEKSLELNNIKDTEYNLNKKLKSINIIFKESENLWNNQKELQDLIFEENALNSREEEIKNSELRVSLAQKVENIIPNINNYENSLIDLSKLEKENEKLENEFKILYYKKNSIDKSFENIRMKKEDELPNLKAEKNIFEEAICEKKQIDKLNLEVLKDKGELDLLINLEKTNKDTIEQNEKRVKIGEKLTKETEDKLESTKVDEEIRRKVIKGVNITEKIKTVNENIKKIDKKKKEIENKIKQNKENKELKSLSLEKQKNILSEKEEELKKLNQDFTYNQDDLSTIKIKINDYENKLKNTNKIKKDIDIYKKDIKNIKKLIENDIKNKEILKGEVNKIKYDIKLLERENILKEIKKNLKEGDICPLCGSTHHKLDKIEHYSENVDSLKNQKILGEKEDAFNKLNSNILSNMSKLGVYEDNLRDNIELLEKDYKNISQNSLEKLNKEHKCMKEQFSIYENSKKDIENQIEFLKEDINKLFSDIEKTIFLIDEGRKRFKEEEEALEKEIDLLEIITIEFNNLKEEMGIDNFLSKQIEIDEKIELAQQIENNLKKYKNRLSDLKLEKDKSERELVQIEKEIVKLESALKEKIANKTEKELSLKKKVKFTDKLEEKLKDIDLRIKNIEKDFNNQQKIKEEIDNYYLKCDRNLQNNLTELKGSKRNCDNYFNIIKELLEKYNLKSIEEVKKNSINSKILIKLKEDIEIHKAKKLKITGAIDNIKLKIGNKKISNEQWENIKSDKEELEIGFKNIIKEKTKKESEIEIINDKLSKVKSLLKDKEKLDKKLGLLNDLDKLFKGKKFIEFVALNQLKYISLEASKRLQEITRGMYSLETDDNGQFIIRDYKNGGRLRDVSTLSGGEVFLVSFSLALALSSQIQLKGSAPLELFFLDEGFGTLDENLLDIVMDSIEKIHNEKLKIGIISHVEAIKDRVPVKLILTPAESGKGGSKVKIEKN